VTCIWSLCGHFYLYVLNTLKKLEECGILYLYDLNTLKTLGESFSAYMQYHTEST